MTTQPDSLTPARAAAEDLAATGRHAHYASEGETVCLTAECDLVDILAGTY